MRQIRLLTAATAALVLAAASAAAQRPVLQPAGSPPPDTATGPGHDITAAVTPAPGQHASIAVTLGRLPNFTTLVSLIREAGLMPTFRSSAPVTLFAPTDAAFAKLPPGELDQLRANRTQLRNVLLHHVVNGKLTGNELLKLRTARTLEGSRIRFGYANGHVVINDHARIVEPGIQVTNGTIHGIDALIVPSF